MVFFTCQHCNEALKKPAVEKHYYTKCRRNPYLTCVDCLKDFRGDEYVSHTSCISEEQRYGGKDYVAKPTGVKQNKWLETVQSCINKNENPRYIPIFQTLSDKINVPRKKPKFINFMSNALNMKNTALITEIFDLFEKEFLESKVKNITENGNQNPSKSSNGTGENHLSKKDKENKGKDFTELENCQINVISHENNGLENQPSKMKKKSKNRQSYEDNGDVLDEMNLSISKTCMEELLNSSENKKEKNKSKKDKASESQNIQETNTGTMEVEENASQSELPEIKKLSKKELKKLKKKEKYENELKQIELEEKIDINMGEEEVQQENETSKKKKKRKATDSLSENDQSKKQKTEEKNSGMHEETPTELQDLIEGPRNRGKFDWEEVIKEILNKASDHEMSVKRLSKKVLTEYQSVKGDRETFEQLMSKFNKKINKIPGVRILKDKAKLLS